MLLHFSFFLSPYLKTRKMALNWQICLLIKSETDKNGVPNLRGKKGEK